MTPVLTIRNLSVRFGQAEAVRGVSMTLHAGRTLAVVGESGSGKSVTALAAIGLLPPNAQVTSGTIELATESGRTNTLALNERELRAVRGGEIAMIFQEPMTALNPVLSVGEQVAEAVRLHAPKLKPKQVRARSIEALERVGIRDAADRFGSFPHEFSGGMRQRVMIAIALACGPRVLLADEPTTALDVTVQARVLDLISDIRDREKVGVLLISHDLAVVAQRADDLCVMYRGRVVEYGKSVEIVADPKHPYTRALLACAPVLGAKAERLSTVAGTVKGDERIGSVTAWWPDAAPPADAEPGRPVRLARVAPGRWAAVWNTPSAAELPDELPDTTDPTRSNKEAEPCAS